MGGTVNFSVGTTLTRSLGSVLMNGIARGAGSPSPTTYTTDLNTMATYLKDGNAAPNSDGMIPSQYDFYYTGVGGATAGVSGDSANSTSISNFSTQGVGSIPSGSRITLTWNSYTYFSANTLTAGQTFLLKGGLEMGTASAPNTLSTNTNSEVSLTYTNTSFATSPAGGYLQTKTINACADGSEITESVVNAMTWKLTHIYSRNDGVAMNELLRTHTMNFSAAYDNKPVTSNVFPTSGVNNVSSSFPTITWSYSDDTSAQSGFQVQVYKESDNSIVADSGNVSGSGTSWQMTSPLPWNESVRVRVRTRQVWSGGGGDFWSDYAISGGSLKYFFTLPSVTSPSTVSGQVVVLNTATPTIAWGSGGTQQAYQVQLVRSSDSVVLEDSGVVVSATRSYVPVNPLVLGTVYIARVRMRDAAAGSWTDYFSTPGEFTSFNQVFINAASPGFKSLNQMLLGGTGDGHSVWQPDSGQGVYTWAENALASNPNRPIFVLTGSYETHSRFNDFTGGISGATLKVNESSTYSNGFDAVTNTSNGLYSAPQSSAEINLRDLDASAQKMIRTTAGTTGQEWFGRWNLPTTKVDTVTASCYVRMGTATAANSSALALGIFSSGNVLIGGIRINQTNSTFHYVSNGTKTSAGTALSGTWSANLWYRLEVFYSIPTNTLTFNVAVINNSDSDSPSVSVTQTGAPGALLAPSYVTVGDSLSSTTIGMTGTYMFEYPKVSWDMNGTTVSKAEWIADALTTRNMPKVSSLILMNGDYFEDLNVSHLNYSTISDAGLFGRLATVWRNSGDTRLDSSKITEEQVKRSLNSGYRNNERIHTAPQVYELGYQKSTSVSQLEYMYLSEVGKASLYLYPRLNGILLQDMDLGIASVRGVLEERAMNDGIRDFSRFIGSKAVTLNLVCFSDKSGSAAYYADVVGAWANPRRRVRLYYKMKDGVERYINLRPDTTNGQWTTDGRRQGIKETTLSFVGVDGKDYASAERNQLIRANTTTDLLVYGTAATPAKIRIFGGTTGCLNPTIVLSSKENEDMTVSARVSMGILNASQISVPANQFIEIDLDSRTAQLNGLPGNANNYARYLSERQWYLLETYINSLYMTTSDSNGYANVIWRDAYL